MCLGLAPRGDLLRAGSVTRPPCGVTSQSPGSCFTTPFGPNRWQDGPVGSLLLAQRGLGTQSQPLGEMGALGEGPNGSKKGRQPVHGLPGEERSGRGRPTLGLCLTFVFSSSVVFPYAMKSVSSDLVHLLQSWAKKPKRTQLLL